MKRWSSQERLKCGCEAGYNFEPSFCAVARGGKPLTNYLVVCAQIAGRKLIGVRVPEL